MVLQLKKIKLVLQTNVEKIKDNKSLLVFIITYEYPTFKNPFQSNKETLASSLYT